jgi:hypothetical protein
VAKLEKRAVWDDDGSEQWRLLPLSEARKKEEEVRPKSHPELLRPTSFLAREIAADLTNNEPRYRSINILSFDLDMPERTTADYEVDVNPNVRAALTAALRDDEQLEVEAEENLPSMGGSGWVPGQEGRGGPPNLGGGNNRSGESNAQMAAKLAGRDRTADAARRKAAAKKAAAKKKSEEDELNALLGGDLGGGGGGGGGGKDAPPEAAFPQSRGLLGKGRMR